MAAERRPNDPEPLSLWTVYDHPRDMPYHFVARRFEVSGGPPRITEEIMFSKQLEPLREELYKRGLTCLARSPEDDPVIVETWV